MVLHYYDYYSCYYYYSSYYYPCTTATLSPAEYTAVGVGLSLTPLHLNVSQPGAAYAVTAIGLYRVSTQNPLYSLSLYAEVQPHTVTDVQVTLNQTIVPVVFTQVLDLDSSGEVQPWEPMTVHVQGLTDISQGSNLFIVYSNNTTNGCPGNTPSLRMSLNNSATGCVSITARVLQVDERSNGLWLAVSFPTPVEVRSLNQALVEIMTASFVVSTSGT
jgi:hypothetical protein